MRALIAMSGGVDSSVAALLAKEAGYECVGCTMKLFDAPEDADGCRTCCSLRDTEDARQVAFRLGMPYYVFNFKDEFEERVIGKFIRGYCAGITPNPCVDCNRYLKFGSLFSRAQILRCEKIVTGHYARIEEENGRYLLKKALDSTKDQSYVLWMLTQRQLSGLLLPLGEKKKTEVRALAAQHGFPTAEKPDSQDICFVPDGDYAAVIGQRTGKTFAPGRFVLPDGTPIGTHRGIVHYTVGQRKHLGVTSARPLYVKEIRTETNEVVLSPEEGLYASEARVRDVNWIAGEAPAMPVRCAVKVRYRQPEQSALLIPQEDGTVLIWFDSPQRAVTPGQAAVFYTGDTVLGGGEFFSDPFDGSEKVCYNTNGM